jgi:hypothetical protein
VIIEETLSMPQQRVPPGQYAAFGDFARAVDRAQSQDLVIGP